MNFGTILNSVANKCVKLVIECENEKSKSLSKDFVKYIQLKEVLKRQFYVYNQLNSTYIEDKSSAKHFVMEVLSTLDEYSFEDILTYNHLLETKFNVDKIASTDIDMDISKVIKYRTSIEKINQLEYIESINRIVEHISTKIEKIDNGVSINEEIAESELQFLQPKHVFRLALKKFNEKYSRNFSEDDRIVFNTLREGNVDKIEELYSDIYIELLNEFAKFEIKNDRDLAEKINSAMVAVGQKCSKENLLNAYDLLSELKKLNGELVETK